MLRLEKRHLSSFLYFSYQQERKSHHNKKNLKSIQINKSIEILKFIQKEKNKNKTIIGIDEAQFFDNKLPDICNEIANMGIKLIIAGLDMDSDGKPFGPMPFMLAIAENIIKLKAKCSITGKNAHYTKSLIKKEQKIKIGDNNTYTVLCRKEFYKNEK